MSDRILIDTNIFVYAYVSNSDEKHKKANELFKSGLVGKSIIISTQVLNEFYSAMTKYNIGHNEISSMISDICRDAEVASLSLPTVNTCLELRVKYGYSYWDSLILSSALENGCGTVLSEDMQHMQIIEGKLTIINPFA